MDFCIWISSVVFVYFTEFLRVADGGMTLELSLEINKKLQVLLLLFLLSCFQSPVSYILLPPGCTGGHTVEEHHIEGVP